MGWLAAFLLGILFGPKIKARIDSPTHGREPWPGEQPPSPPTHDEQPPAPPRGYLHHPDPIPYKARQRAYDWEPKLRELYVGAMAGPEVDDWRDDGHPYAILFRYDSYRGRKGIGLYVADEATKQPPTTKQPPAKPPAIPLPGGWRAHPSPMPPRVVSTAQGLLGPLWSKGEGANTTIFDNWWQEDTKEPYEVLFRAEYHAPDKKGVSAYTKR